MVETEQLVINDRNLAVKEIEALEKFITRLEDEHSGEVHSVTLYGSKARGDASEDSDIDLLILTRQESAVLRRDVIKIASQVSLYFDVLISPRVIGLNRWLKQKTFSLNRIVDQEGIRLYG